VLVALAEGRSSLAEAIRARTVTVTGDREALRRLRTLFRRPQHVDRQVASQDRG
jgi:hypothetical protein